MPKVAQPRKPVLFKRDRGLQARIQRGARAEVRSGTSLTPKSDLAAWGEGVELPPNTGAPSAPPEGALMLAPWVVAESDLFMAYTLNSPQRRGPQAGIWA